MPAPPTASVLAEIALFAGGLSWLAILTHSVSQAIRLGLYWFVFAEVIKIMMAAALARRLAAHPQGPTMTPNRNHFREDARTRGQSAFRDPHITVAHSPDSDDAFMFYGLATNKVRVPGLHFTHTLCDIETLNRKAMEGVYDVTAISFHAYPYIQEHYALLPSGGSVGDGYGPMIVAQRAFSPQDIKGKRIAVPGTMTTAYLVLKLFAPGH